MAAELSAIEARARRGRAAAGWLWLAPALLALAIFYAVPLGQMVQRSLWAEGFTLAHYAHIIGEDVYRRVFWITLQVSVLVTLAALIIGYPAAYLLSGLRGRALQLALVFVLLPFWISVLVRNYAWLSLLARQGVVNTTLISLGIIDEPLPLMFNLTGVVIGMTYVLVPFMILSLYAVMHGIDRQLLRASASLGARPLQTFWRIFFPQTLPGIWAGSLLVFITAIGFFITPALLGGGRVPMIATLIESQVRGVLNFGVGSALGVALLVLVLALCLVFSRALSIERMLGGGR